MARLGPCVLALAAAMVGFPAAARALTDIDGTERPLPPELEAKGMVVFYVTHDCPISNRYALEIGRICTEYGAQGVHCLMAYVDPTISAEDIRGHRREYGKAAPAVHDRDQSLVRLAGATVTPEAAVLDEAGQLVYRGRIDNLYAALGTPRRKATELDLRRALDELVAGEPVSQPRTQAVGCFIPNWKAIQQGDTE